MTSDHLKEQSTANISDVVITPDSADMSILQQPLNHGIKNVRQILNCIKSGSREIRDIILNECDIIYECKVCRSLFRSLANFLYHKRGFCKKHLCESMLLFEHFEEEDTETIIINDGKSNDAKSESTKIVSKQPDANIPKEEVKVDSLSAEEKTNSLLSKEMEYNGDRNEETNPLDVEVKQEIDEKNTPYLKTAKSLDAKIAREKIKNIFSISLKPISGNPNAVLQTVQKGSSEICSNLINDSKESIDSDSSTDSKLKENEDLTGEDGTIVNSDAHQESLLMPKSKDIHLTRRKRLLNRTDCNVQSLKCLKCNSQFTTLKTLYFHMMSFHSHKRMYFPCPFCKTLFVQMYGVTRHLIQVHGKTKEQINNRLREAIRKTVIWKKVDLTSLDEVGGVEQSSREEIKIEKSEDLPEKEVETQEKQIESNNQAENNAMMHHCSKCKRVFARRSSQVSHEKFCIMNSSPTKVENAEQQAAQLSPTRKVETKPPIEIRLNVRPKRAAEKRMHKDFVDSQTLKWRSANKLSSAKPTPPVVSKQAEKAHERKIMSMVNTEKLLCLKCDKKFSSFSNLRRHAAIHIGWTRYKCKCCDYQSYNNSDCMHHIERMHPSVPEEKIEKHVINLVADISPPRAKSSSQAVKVAEVSREKGNRKTKGAGKRKARSPSQQKRKQPCLETKKEVISYVQKKKKKPLKSVEKSPDFYEKKFPNNYKSVTTSNPTTIILSKTCSSSSVKITNSVVPVRPIDAARVSLRSTDVVSPKQIRNAVSSNHQNNVNSNHKTSMIKIRVPYQVSGKPQAESSIKGSQEKKNRTISDWFVKKEPSSNRRDSAPVIIDLVAASSTNISRSKNTSPTK